jgi:hypothetical protein
MAYSFLNSTTYSNDPLVQGDFSAFLPAQTQQESPLGSGLDLPEDSDLIEIVASASNNIESDEQDVTQEQSPSVQERDLSEDSDPQVDMELLNFMFQQEPEVKRRVRSYTPPPPSTEEDNEDNTPAPIVKAPRSGKLTPRIYQNGGNTLYAETYNQQRIGLNDPNYNTAIFNTKGTNTFRGLDNYQPVMVTDGSKYKVLNGPQDTAKFSGKVYEHKLKMQMGGSVKNDVKSFYNEYLNSDNYKTRLAAQGHTNPIELINDRLTNLKGTDYLEDDFLPSAYQPGNYTVVINPKQSAEDGMPVRTVASHEFSHVVGASQDKIMKNPNLELNQNEMNAFSTKNKLRGKNTAGMTEQQKLDVEHDSRPSESKADLDALRFRLFQDKIYNTGTQEFSPELLKQAKERYKDDNMVNRLFQNFSDDDLIYLMNNIAKNNKNNNRNIYG